MITTLLYAPVESEPQILHALRKILEFPDRGRVVLYSSVKPPLPSEVSHVPATPMDWAQQQKHQATALLDYTQTDDTHLLHCECDGFPINPQLWDPTWVQYDYIGAPWGAPGSPTAPVRGDGLYRVGNGGFSLRSRKLLTQCWKLRNEYPTGEASDVWLCQYPYLRSRLGKLNWAPIPVALRFSFEAPIPEYPNWDTTKSFGFHGRNFHPNLCKIN